MRSQAMPRSVPRRLPKCTCISWVAPRHGWPSRPTAFAHRDAPFVYNIIGMWSEPADSERNLAWVRSFGEAMRSLGAGAYINFLADQAADRVRSAYGRNYERLVAVKDRHDPTSLFRFNQNIPPSVMKAA